MCLEFQQMKPKEQIMHNEIPRKPWEVVGADMFTLHNKHYLCIVDYHSKVPITKKTEDLAADSLILACTIIIFRIQHTKKIISDVGSNFISEKKTVKFCRKLNMEHVVSSSYHHQSNGQVEACTKLVKCTIKNVMTLTHIYT